MPLDTALGSLSKINWTGGEKVGITRFSFGANPDREDCISQSASLRPDTAPRGICVIPTMIVVPTCNRSNPALLMLRSARCSSGYQRDAINYGRIAVREPAGDGC